MARPPFGDSLPALQAFAAALSAAALGALEGEFNDRLGDGPFVSVADVAGALEAALGLTTHHAAAVAGVCDSTGAGVIRWRQVQALVAACSEADGILGAGQAVPPFRLTRTLQELPTGVAQRHESVSSKLRTSVGLQQLMVLPDMRWVAATEARSADVVLMRAKDMSLVGTLRQPRTAVSVPGVSVEAAVAFYGACRPAEASGADLPPLSSGASMPLDDPSHAYIVTAASNATMSVWNVSPADGTPCSLVRSWSTSDPQQALAYNRRYSTVYSGCMQVCGCGMCFANLCAAARAHFYSSLSVVLPPIPASTAGPHPRLGRVHGDLSRGYGRPHGLRDRIA